MVALIIIFVVASYYFGAKAIIQNKYSPSIYSRIIWLLLATNSYASVVALKNNFEVLLLAGMGLLGSLLILLLSLRKAKQIVGATEIISTILLAISLCIWIFTKLPLLNLSIGLIAHFIGGIPTYTKVIRDPKDEDTLFWLFFAIATSISLISADKSQVSGYLYPLYLFIFECGMTLLCLRRYIKNKL